MAENKQSHLIASVKMQNIDFINKHIINLGIGGGGYLVLINNQLLVLKFFPLAPPLLPSPIHFSVKCRRNR